MSADDILGFWLAQAGRVPMLTPAEELHLGGMVRAWRDHPDGPDGAPERVQRRGRRSRDRMVSANLRLVVAVAQRMGRRMERADALQEGAIGLQRAAEKFDPERGYKFSTYAYWWIRQAITRGGELYGRTIRLPTHLAQALAAFDAKRAQLEMALGRLPSLAELAAELRLPPREVALFLDRGRPIGSLDAVVGDGDSRLIDLVPCPRSDEPEDHDPQLQRLVQLLELWEERAADGSPRHPTACHYAELLRGHYGVDGPPQTMAQLGAARGLSRHQISYRLERGRAALRAGRLPPEDPSQLEILRHV